jgi:hypothetical protein
VCPRPDSWRRSQRIGLAGQGIERCDAMTTVDLLYWISDPRWIAAALDKAG